MSLVYACMILFSTVMKLKNIAAIIIVKFLRKIFHGCSDMVFHLGQKTYQIHFGIFSSECLYLEGKTS